MERGIEALFAQSYSKNLGLYAGASALIFRCIALCSLGRIQTALSSVMQEISGHIECLASLHLQIAQALSGISAGMLVLRRRSSASVAAESGTVLAIDVFPLPPAERVGAFTYVGVDAETTKKVLSQCKRIARAIYR